MHVIDDSDNDLDEVRRVVLCSGKIYYDLLARKQKLGARDIALVRLDQIFPFPKKEIDRILKKYRNNMLTLWVQEEPENMGAWYHIKNALKDIEIIVRRDEKLSQEEVLKNKNGKDVWDSAKFYILFVWPVASSIRCFSPSSGPLAKRISPGSIIVFLLGP